MIGAGSRAMVTGGGVRLGREIALTLARAGVNVCIHYGSSEEAAQQTLEEVREFGVDATAVQADLRDPVTAADQMFECVAEVFGAVDILINNAAIFEPGSLDETDESAWDRHLDINLKAPFFLTQRFARQLASGHDGAVVNIIDWRASRPRPGHAAYTIAKGGLLTMTRLLALELAPRIRVNAVSPGAILPPPGSDNEYLQQLAGKIPLQRTGSPAQVTDAVMFLLRSDFLTGEVVQVTGGEHL
ncbi:3-oxoacyl-[acyl-carrier-protein] reductase FabG [Maioricimonas rarisocia]|uniref:3-oxoacyl-[acyl-carrier-protein] reductase FabG n=1 Tax=Maioricimonas rarisocia TaxID=2528026 RepID=A0A517Z7W3_9PLAN|nr:SDR family oxidoreductase [Maioricimonas rarisocia]QDU38554.1 3-oxoacyl-[acyl-carrier-protein] reductase FabG [Maioricimonas rarisocia]